MRTQGLRSLRPSLWMILAVLAALGVASTHVIHLALATRISTSALSQAQEALARTLARVVAQNAMDALLVSDVPTAQETVLSAVRSGNLAYCFIQRGDEVLASSFRGGTPPSLVRLRADDGSPTPETLIVRVGKTRFLDAAHPVNDGRHGTVRVGLKMDLVDGAERDMARLLGWAAVTAILVGLVGAFAIGRVLARPVAKLVDAVDAFDPTAEATVLSPRGAREIAQLTDRFNRMMVRLKAAHDEQERTQQKNVETQRLAALGALVAGVAHEVNNPLAGIKNCHHRLLKDDLPASKRQEYMDLMRDALDRLQHVVQGLLDFGRPRALDLGGIPLVDLVRDASAMMRPVLGARNITLHEDHAGLDPGLCAIADRRQIGQAMLNILLNAAYVTPNGGRINVRLRRQDGRCGLSVQDEGPGIPEAIRARVFDPFFTTKPPGDGTGLGLSVTRSIVAVHGGELALDFPVTGGTVVTVWLREADQAQDNAV